MISIGMGSDFPKNFRCPFTTWMKFLKKSKRPDDVRTNPTVQETSATFLATGKNNSKVSSVYLRPKYYDLNRYGIGFPKKLSLPFYNVIENFFFKYNVRTSSGRLDVIWTSLKIFGISKTFLTVGEYNTKISLVGLRQKNYDLKTHPNSFSPKFFLSA